MLELNQVIVLGALPLYVSKYLLCTYHVDNINQSTMHTRHRLRTRPEGARSFTAKEGDKGEEK